MSGADIDGQHVDEVRETVRRLRSVPEQRLRRLVKSLLLVDEEAAQGGTRSGFESGEDRAKLPVIHG